MPNTQPGVSLQAKIHGGEIQASQWVEGTELKVYKVARISRVKKKNENRELHPVRTPETEKSAKVFEY